MEQTGPIHAFFRAKHDREMIVAWKVDLDRILKVFNACSIASVRLLLIFRIQAEPIILLAQRRGERGSEGGIQEG